MKAQQTFYDYNYCVIKYQAVDEALRSARQTFSGFLVNLVAEMLQIEEANRPTFTVLQTILAPYKK